MITLADIQAARARLSDAVLLSPCAYSETFSQLCGNTIFFKLENLQVTGSFKERGARNKLLRLNADEKKRGVIAASAGNHAQGVAYHANKEGIRAQIVMPVSASLIKVSATRAYGADVVLHGQNYDEACAEALKRCAAEGWVFVHPFDDDDVIAGQGTLGLELVEQLPDVEAVIIPIGGGGLIGGVACAIKEQRPKVQIIGVQTARLPSMKRAVEAHQPVLLPAAATIADGLAARQAGERTLRLVEKYVDDIVLVEEEEIASAILLLLEREKTLAEGAGAGAAACMVHGHTTLRNKKVVVLVSGGNIDVNFLARIIERGLIKTGRLIRLRLRLPDHPGVLYQLTRLIAECQANIMDIAHSRAYYGVALGETAVDITLETRGPDHVTELVQRLTDADYAFEWVA